ncbi:MAG: class I SAM-dependent methyltransferase [Arcicella sp.]|jgi:2-polyprenyl-3-methyl-5-hydroxy-6-metoxy-1,4-benzoquinol methylase|nr:class I SAM-dependent methyltransferase [Arcicella sp.]
MNNNRKTHWESVFTNKKPTDVSWFQEKPTTSLEFIRSLNLPKDAQIIDVGGGDSFLVDYLLKDGFENITVLDISEKALEKAKKRLENDAEKVTWIVCDIVDYQENTSKYDVWHDRAAFHFLTEKNQVEAYLSIAAKSVKNSGFMSVGTFSEQGPTKCSGLEIKQYSEYSMTATFEENFRKIKCINENHETPFNTIQNFTFCTFQRK